MSTARQPQPERTACTPCRGTGTLLSGKGGTPHPITCPWCEGTGRFASGHDAQAHPAESGAAPSAG